MFDKSIDRLLDKQIIINKFTGNIRVILKKSLIKKLEEKDGLVQQFLSNINFKGILQHRKKK